MFSLSFSVAEWQVSLGSWWDPVSWFQRVAPGGIAGWEDVWTVYVATMFGNGTPNGAVVKMPRPALKPPDHGSTQVTVRTGSRCCATSVTSQVINLFINLATSFLQSDTTARARHLFGVQRQRSKKSLLTPKKAATRDASVTRMFQTTRINAYSE